MASNIVNAPIQLEECPCAPLVVISKYRSGYLGGNEVEFLNEAHKGNHEWRFIETNYPNHRIDPVKTYYCIWCLDEKRVNSKV